MKTIDSYKSIIFDCDGVILNSNKIKTRAFYNTALPYGEKAANALVDYHVTHGGVSRYKKFKLFLETMVSNEQIGFSLEDLLQTYAMEVRQGLMACDVALGLERLREQTHHTKWLVVSGGDQLELQHVFSERELMHLFDGGIFGSPDTKDDILARESKNKNIITPGLFLGDSKYDHIAASRAGLDFVFLSQWSEFSDWESYCATNALPVLRNINDLVID